MKRLLVINAALLLTAAFLSAGCVSKPAEDQQGSHIPISSERAAPPSGWIDYCKRYPSDGACNVK